MSILIHMCPLSILLRKKNISIVLTADTFNSFIEAVDELFQHTLAFECMGNDVYTIAILYMWLLPILSKKKGRFILN